MFDKITIPPIKEPYRIEYDGQYEIHIYKNRKEWWTNGQRHRDNDLPSIEYSDGTKMWHQHGKIHRETGPAIIWEPFLLNTWYLNDVQYNELDFKIALRKLKLEKLLSIP